MDWPRRPFLYTYRPDQKHNLGRGCLDLASCHVSLNSVQRFERKSWKYFSQWETRTTILFLRLARKHKLGRGHWFLASGQVSLNFCSAVYSRSRKCLSQSEIRVAILFGFFFSIGLKKQTRKRTLRSCFLSSLVEFRTTVSEEKSKMSQPIRGQGGHCVFPIGRKTQTW